MNGPNAVTTNLLLLLIAVAAIIGFSEQMSIMERIPEIPFAEGADTAVDWLDTNLTVVFDRIGDVISAVLTPVQYILTELPAILVVVALSALGYALGGWRLGLFMLVAFVFVTSINLFEPMMVTLSLVLTAVFFAILIGIPLGIIKAHVPSFSAALDPVLDFMQSLPLFVYLIPVILFWGIGNISGIVATFIFSMPPTVRLTALGIQQLPKELIEAGQAFGSTKWQFLSKVELPLSMPSIMAGINQTIMLALAMVVVAAMVGAEGLGNIVYASIVQLKVGEGIASGVGLVLLAMILDRITKAAWNRLQN
jgi:glycine betaine/proline transport system permease protein